MSIDESSAAKLRASFTPDAFAALKHFCQTREKTKVNALVSATEDRETWLLRGEINTLRLFMDLEETVKNFRSGT